MTKPETPPSNMEDDATAGNGRRVLAEDGGLILYEVLLRLPQKDLLLSQRVCRGWRNTIKRSQKLQAALFLCPDVDDEQTGQTQANPLLQDKFAPFYDGEFHSSIGARDNLGPWRGLDWFKSLTDGRRDAFSRAEASWRAMLPFKPCTKAVEVHYSSFYQAGSQSEVRYLTFPLEPHEDHSPSKGAEEVVASKDATDGAALPDEDHEGSSATASAEPSPAAPWLTFGLLYDVLEKSWFQCWYSHPNSLSIRWPATARDERKPAAEADDGEHSDDSEGSVWETLSGVRRRNSIGPGPRTITVSVSYTAQCTMGFWSGYKGYRDEFRSEGAAKLTDSVWSRKKSLGMF